MKFLKMAAVLLLAVICLCSCGGADESTITSCDAGVGTFYYPDADFAVYQTKEMEFDGTAQDVIDKLYELGAYRHNKVKVNSWYIKSKIMYIDFDKGFEAATGSTALEYFSVMGTVKTLISCFDVDAVRLTVNGKDFYTAHGIYDTPLY